MATLELSKGSVVYPQDGGGGGGGQREEAYTRFADNTPLFPSVPTHTPRQILSRQEDGDDAVRRVHAVRDEEEMEEVLEELQDDEMEEMADSPDVVSPDDASDLLGRELDTLALLDSAQSVCTTLIQDLVTLEQLSSAAEGDISDDGLLLTPLRDLGVVILAAKETAGILDSRYLQLEADEVTSPTTSQASSVSPKDMLVPQAQQQSRAQRLYGLGRHGSTSSPLNSPTPSTSREELRNPFSDVLVRSPNTASEDRLRNRSDHESESVSRLNKTLRGVDKRCTEVIATLENVSMVESTSESEDKMLKTWLHLQRLSKSIQQTLASRRTLHLAADVRKGPQSPSTYSPTYSPSRGRSRKNSNASLQSGSISLHSVEGGDPVGEATAAGVGVGVTRSLSRLSSLSGRNGSGSGTALLAASTSYMTGSPHARRERTGSEGTIAASIQSAPPRYSEESARKWSENVLGASRGGETELLEGGQERERASSGGDLSDLYSRALPAYNSTEVPYQKMSSGSMSSLQKLEHSTTFPRDEKKGSLGFSEASQQSPSHSTTAAEYSARTSQDLRMVESSIERLYTAVPQLDDQRASSPTEIKQRQSKDVLLLIDQLTKSGRMEDQRAVLPVEAPLRDASVASSPETRTSEASAVVGLPLTAPLSNTRLGRRLGSISFGKNLSMRLATSVLGSDGKGKERERSDGVEDQSLTASPRAADLDDLLPLAHQVQAASERGYQDQRAQIRPKAAGKKKPSNLDLLGVSVSRWKEERVPLELFTDLLFAQFRL